MRGAEQAVSSGSLAGAPNIRGEFGDQAQARPLHKVTRKGPGMYTNDGPDVPAFRSEVYVQWRCVRYKQCVAAVAMCIHHDICHGY